MIHGRKSVAVGVIVGLAVFAASALGASRAVAPGESPQTIQSGVFVAIPFLIVVTFAGSRLGHPSGHDVVAGAPTVILVPHLPAHSRWLPLDLIGGVALGRAEWVAT